jgi:tetratricopeptide (TPR) repeat protein
MTAPPFDPNAELQAAQAAVRNRQPQTAFIHLARLMPQFPIHPLVTGLLNELLKITPDPLPFVPDGPAEYGPVAVRAYTLGWLGKGAEAYALLQQLASATPGNGIIDWALPWLEGGLLTDARRAEAVARYFVSAHYRFGNRKELPPESQAVAKRWLPHARAAMAAKPFDDMLYTAHIILLRQVGEMDEAVHLCTERHRALGSYHSAVSLAATYREARQFEEWFAATQEILRIAPDDVPVRLDLGDCFWEEQKKLAEAEKWYADAVRLEPENAWARPSLLSVRYQLTNESRWRNELEDYAVTHPGDQRTEVCLGRITPFFADFVYPADGSVNNMTDIAQQVEAARAQGNNEPLSGQIKSTTTGLDVPSCRRSIDRQLAAWGGITLERTVLGMQSPDPREPRVPVRYRLWTYDGTTPQPAVPPPPPEVAVAVAELALVRYDLLVWIGCAVQLGGRLGPGGVDALLGVMAHPPAPQPGWRDWDWTARVQFAAALVLAGTGPTALDVLIDLANGPLDWTTAAAVVALTAVARSRPELAPRVRQLFTELYRSLPRPGANYYENVILNCHLRLPNLPPEERAAVRAEREEYENRAHTRMSEAEMAARMFLARPVPPGADTFEMMRLVIRAFTLPGSRDHPGFATTLAATLGLAEVLAGGGEGEVKAYLEEQARVLRLISAETTPPTT